MKNKLIIVTLSLLEIGSSGRAYDLSGPVGIERIFAIKEERKEKKSFRLISGAEVELNIPLNKEFGKLRRKNKQQIEEILFITKTKKDVTEEKEYIDVNITREDLEDLKSCGRLTCLSADGRYAIALHAWNDEYKTLTISDVRFDKAYSSYALMKKI